MAKPKLGSKTPDNSDTNALLDEKLELPARLAKSFTDPKQTNRHVVIGIVQVDKVELIGGGETLSHYSFRLLEFPQAEHLERAEELLFDVHHGRTGADALPGISTDQQLDLTGLDNK